MLGRCRHPSGSTRGGIGANRVHPAEFVCDNLIMRVQLLHEAWRAGVGKFVALGTVCTHSVARRTTSIWNHRTGTQGGIVTDQDA